MQRTNFIVFVLFLFLSAVMTYPLVFHLSSAINDYGDPLLNAWILTWDHHQLFKNPLHLFDTNIFYPHHNTLAYSEHLFASALLSLPVYLFGGGPITAYNVVLFLSFVLCGFGMFLLVKELTKSSLAGVFSGMLFAFSAYRFSHLAHIQILTAQWMPFALLYLHRAFNQPTWKHFGLFGLFFLLQLLSCNYLGVMFSTVVGICFVGLLLPLWKPFPWNRIVKFILTLSVVGLLFLPFAIPYFKVQQEHGFTRQWEDLKPYSAKAENYLGVSGKHRIYPDSLKRYGEPERRLFFGFTAMALALLAIILRDKQTKKHFWLYLFILSFAFLMSLGVRSKVFGISLNGYPYRFFYEWLPGFSGMRVPARFALIGSLALSVLGGIGVAALMGRIKQRGVVLSFTLLLGLGILVDGWCVPLQFKYFTAKPPPVHLWLKDQDDVNAVIYFPIYEGKSVHLEMNHVYWSTYHWKKMVNGYSGFFPPELEDLKQELRSFPSKETVDRLRQMGVNYCVINSGKYPREMWHKLRDQLKQFTDELEFVKQLDYSLVYRIKKKGS